MDKRIGNPKVGHVLLSDSRNESVGKPSLAVSPGGDGCPSAGHASSDSQYRMLFTCASAGKPAEIRRGECGNNRAVK